ncbi:MAG: hypothetical protein HGA97_00595 [Chlorobiaceae bacterium]|nr:hypothetical protein [Chlorobiaceae bacterium]
MPFSTQHRSMTSISGHPDASLQAASTAARPAGQPHSTPLLSGITLSVPLFQVRILVA